jgi:hypothetical protein
LQHRRLLTPSLRPLRRYVGEWSSRLFVQAFVFLSWEGIKKALLPPALSRNSGDHYKANNGCSATREESKRFIVCYSDHSSSSPRQVNICV